ncbi:DUF551 domain-containing protein [Escherichia coli]|uniref:DUF551 domain-containing protein n=1 Tax=Escherichia coli TaxID=562 RepID=UPI003F627FA7
MTTMNREEQKQVLIDTANHIINRDNTSPYSENLRELARIALASLEAEPVGAFHIAEQQVDGTSDYLKDGEWPIDNGIIEVYAAPLVPVVPAALPENDDEDGHDIDYLEPSEVYALGRTAGWNACRAAMLYGAEPVSQTCKLPVNTPCQDAPAHIWLQTAGVWPEDGELSELTWCSHNQHHDDTLYVRADLVNGNSPGTPDSWISCSDRMPNEEDVLVYCSDTKEQMVGFHKGKGLFQFFYMNGVEGVCEPSHWMPPPEPPL